MRCQDYADKASKLIGGDRADQHGDKHDNFSRIGIMWNAWLEARGFDTSDGDRLTPEDVAQMMSLMKKARTLTGNWNHDDFVDDLGYTAIAAELSEPETIVPPAGEEPLQPKSLTAPGNTTKDIMRMLHPPDPSEPMEMLKRQEKLQRGAPIRDASDPGYRAARLVPRMSGAVQMPSFQEEAESESSDDISGADRSLSAAPDLPSTYADDPMRGS